MKKPNAIKLVAGLALAAVIALLGVYFLWLDRAPADVAPAIAPQPPETAVRFDNAVTIRNLTSEWVTFTVTPFGSLQPSALKSLRPGGLEKVEEREGLVLAYWRGDVEQTAILRAGMPYCFRYNERDGLQVYPGSHMMTDVEDLAPFLPTPETVVDKMLDMAKIGRSDVVYDIGCGDGRIVVRAAKKFGARGVGVDIDPERIREAEAAARQAGVEARAKFRVEDAMTTDFSEATVVTLYLLPESNAIMRPRLEHLLKPGARVVSHNYSIKGWDAKLVDSATLTDPSGAEHTVFLYRR